MRLTPQRPPAGAPRIDQLRYWRRYNLFNATLVVPLLVIGVLVNQIAIVIVSLVGGSVPLIASFVYMAQIRRERQRSA